MTVAKIETKEFIHVLTFCGNQMNELSEQINTKFVFKRPIINAGRSLAITISTGLVKFYGLKKGEKVSLIPERKHLFKVKIS